MIHYPLARQVVMYILWKLDGYTLAQIGGILGGRTPATVSYGFQKISRQLIDDGELRQMLDKIYLSVSRNGEN